MEKLKKNIYFPQCLPFCIELCFLTHLYESKGRELWQSRLVLGLLDRGREEHPIQSYAFDFLGKFSFWSSQKIQSALIIPTLDTTTKFVTLTIWLAQKPFLKRWQLFRNYAGTLLFNISSNKCFGYLLESPQWSDSNKYPKHTSYIL